MKVLVTGITGFAGSHLVDYLLTLSGVEVMGIQRWRSRTENIEHFKDKVRLVECDLRDASSVRDVIDQLRPDRIFHLAAQSFVPTSWTAPTESLVTNIIGQLNIFEAVKKLQIMPRIQLACSSEQYGMVHEPELPIKETNPMRPLSPYAVSKVGQDMLGYQYWMSFKIPIIRTRGFNHEGPRRGPVFVCSDFAKQIADIEKGRKPPVIRVGNLDARRDFSDVRRDARHAARHDEGEGQDRAGRRAHATERRARPLGRRFQIPEGDRLGNHHSVRADASRPARLLAGAVAVADPRHRRRRICRPASVGASRRRGRMGDTRRGPRAARRDCGAG